MTYIKIGNAWWVKPFSASHKTPISPDGTWLVDITTSDSDPSAANYYKLG